MSILVCDDDALFHRSIEMALGFPITGVFNADQALEALRKKRFDVLFLDIQMRDSQEGLRYLPKLIEAKQQSIARYSAILNLIGLSNPPVAQLLMSHLDQHKQELSAMQALAPRLIKLAPAPGR